MRVALYSLAVDSLRVRCLVCLRASVSICYTRLQSAQSQWSWQRGSSESSIFAHLFHKFQLWSTLGRMHSVRRQHVTQIKKHSSWSCRGCPSTAASYYPVYFVLDIIVFFLCRMGLANCVHSIWDVVLPQGSSYSAIEVALLHLKSRLSQRVPWSVYVCIGVWSVWRRGICLQWSGMAATRPLVKLSDCTHARGDGWLIIGSRRLQCLFRIRQQTRGGGWGLCWISMGRHKGWGSTAWGKASCLQALLWTWGCGICALWRPCWPRWSVSCFFRVLPRQDVAAAWLSLSRLDLHPARLQAPQRHGISRRWCTTFVLLTHFFSHWQWSRTPTGDFSAWRTSAPRLGLLELSHCSWPPRIAMRSTCRLKMAWRRQR